MHRGRLTIDGLQEPADGVFEVEGIIEHHVMVRRVYLGYLGLRRYCAQRCQRCRREQRAVDAAHEEDGTCEPSQNRR